MKDRALFSVPPHFNFKEHLLDYIPTRTQKCAVPYKRNSVHLCALFKMVRLSVSSDPSPACVQRFHIQCGALFVSQNAYHFHYHPSKEIFRNERVKFRTGKEIPRRHSVTHAHSSGTSPLSYSPPLPQAHSLFFFFLSFYFFSPPPHLAALLSHRKRDTHSAFNRYQNELHFTTTHLIYLYIWDFAEKKR